MNSVRFRIPRLSLTEVITFTFGVIMLFMQPLKTLAAPFSLIDEMAVLFCLGVYLLKCFSRMKVKSEEIKVWSIFFLFIIVGLIGNLISGIDRSVNSILTDILSYGKFIIVLIGASVLADDIRHSSWMFSVFTKIIHLLVVIGLVLAVLNQVVDLGMRDDVRYGMYCFPYIYDTAAIFSWYCYMFLLVLTIDLVRGITRRKIIYIVLTIVLWCFTGRSRAFAFAAIYAMLALILYMSEVKHRKLKIRMRYFLLLGGLSVAIAWKQIVFYFTTPTEARNILMLVGLSLCKRYMPFGAGLATFGTAAAQKYYSPIYAQYGLSSRHGFTYDNPLYLTDNFWPAVVGETGILGLVLYVGLIFAIFKFIYKKKPSNNMSRMIIIFFIITMLCSSIATSIFAQNATIADAFYLCLMVALLRENGKRNEGTV